MDWLTKAIVFTLSSRLASTSAPGRLATNTRNSYASWQRSLDRDVLSNLGMVGTLRPLGGILNPLCPTRCAETACSSQPFETSRSFCRSSPPIRLSNPESPLRTYCLCALGSYNRCALGQTRGFDEHHPLGAGRCATSAWHTV